MIPKIFSADALKFQTLGIGALLKTVSCTVTEELNGTFELEATILADDPKIAYVKVGNIISAKPCLNEPDQAFVIESATKNLDGTVNVFATHIAQYRAKLIPVSPFSAVSLSAALLAVKSNSLESNPFTLSTDKTVATSYVLDVPKSMRSILGGEENSILDVYRGEYYFDNLNISLLTRRGSNEDITIFYGKNLTKFQANEEFSWNNSATGVLPYWKQEETVVVGSVQYSSNASELPYKRTVVLDCSEDFETEPTANQLNTFASNWISSRGNDSITIQVGFNQYGLTDEQIQQLSLGDTVHVVNSFYDINYDSRIVSVKFDVLAEKYTDITIGKVKANLNDAVEQIAVSSTTIVNPDTDDYVLKTGSTMTGQLKTSFHESVATGSFEALKNAATNADRTVPNFIDEVRYSSGVVGSVRIHEAYTKDGVTIPANAINGSWYNFIYMPHRSGGVNGTGTGDNHLYGTCIISDMTANNNAFIIRVSSGAIQQVSKFAYETGSSVKGVQTASVSTNSQIADKAESGDLTASITAVTGATNYYAIPSYVNYGYVKSVSIAGTTLTAVLTNASGASHTMYAYFLVFAV